MRFRPITLLGALTLISIRVAAAEPDLEKLWQTPAFEAAPADLLEIAAALEAPEESEIEYLDRRTSFKFDSDGRLTITRYVLFRVLTEEGAETYDSAGVSYAPWHQEKPEIRYRVIPPDGEVFDLDQKTVTDVAISSGLDNIYEDRRRAEAPLPAIEVGSIVEGLRVLRDTMPLFDAGTASKHFLQSSNGPIRRDLTTVVVPEGRDFHYVVGLMDGLEPSVEQRDGAAIYRFETRGVEADAANESGMPPESPRWSYLGLATGKSWSAVATAYAEVVSERIVSSPIPEIEISPDAIGTQAEIEEVLAWLHGRVRYTGLELGAAAILPVEPATTLERRYGDCKDKSTLLAALLASRGIEARLALLRTGPGADLDPGLPGIGQMDHAIVYLPKEDLWIDPDRPVRSCR